LRATKPKTDRGERVATIGSFMDRAYGRLGDVTSKASRSDGVLGRPLQHLSPQQNLRREDEGGRTHIRIQRESSPANLSRNASGCIRVGDRC
jgi:hypothetical protein